MNDVVGALLVVCVALLVVSAVATALVVRWVQRHNRVDPRVRTAAPAVWLYSMRPAARLHRRLRRSVWCARAALDAGMERGAPWGTLVELSGEVADRAVAIDRELVVVHRAPTASRRRLLRELADEVNEVEALNERVIRLAGGRFALPGLPVPAVDPVRERLDALDLALQELAPPQH